MTDSFYSPETLDISGSDSDDYQQIELPIKLDAKFDSFPPATHRLLLDCIEKLDKQQEYLGYLSQGNIEVLMAVNQQDISSTTEEVKTLRKEVIGLAQGVWKIYQHLEKDSIGKELKSGQQNLQKAIEANAQKKNTANIGYLDWKQIATIITATAIVSSLCSLAVFQIATNWKVDRIPTPTEKPLKPKKTAR